MGVVPSFLSSHPAGVVSPRAPVTTRAPVQGVAIKPRRATISPPLASRCARCTTYTCKPGTLRNATAPHASTVAKANQALEAVKVSTNNTNASNADTICNARIGAPEAANNAAANASFVPMLTLGVPGSGTTAVMMGALTLYNITPGPALFEQQPALVWGLIASMFVGNVILLMLNIPLVGFFTRMLKVPSWALVPGILAVSAVGVYAVHSTTFDLILMSALGIAGYALRKCEMPMAPLILGFVLGELMEQNLRRALSITNGELGILWQSPISLALWICAALMIIVPLAFRRILKPVVHPGHPAAAAEAV
jgi:TctA family transporter